MGPVRHLFPLILLLLLGACSLRATIEAVTPDADRAFASATVEAFRSGDRAWLQRHFEPELWAVSAERLSTVPALFPEEAGRTEILAYNISTSLAGGETERRKSFLLVTQGGGRWTTTRFQTFSTGGPDRIVQWAVEPHAKVPPELAMIEAMDRALPWVWVGLAAVLSGLAGLIFWLVRRSRRKHDPWAGGRSAGP